MPQQLGNIDNLNFYCYLSYCVYNGIKVSLILDKADDCNPTELDRVTIIKTADQQYTGEVDNLQ